VRRLLELHVADSGAAQPAAAPYDALGFADTGRREPLATRVLSLRLQSGDVPPPRPQE
jgi:hypothetical protein